ncbi:integral membrane protein [Staphylococcus petrasii]|uniref:DUF805 domain-containing protein n=1 Tax=Staphylococcus petrasii TaxID=1276936 RepID=A0A380FVA4_9STAP|nr:DUF805 domain-containing protein [Staphylococcus petrasii]PNZ30518.1 DUF805 domain-containing protein [Staphylococcus petrasii]TGE12164.1 DUF805 domain-containing protein [Staphylococcus petrasii]TGE17066.1 DUF805 domain-containing protein [Staphylococcus petrasii]SUM42645.1 integral membrane protein [Staphylococcus petrasii]
MNPKVTFGQAFKLFWKNYFNFKGRSRRSEYWFMQLWHLIFYIPALIVYYVGLVSFILAFTTSIKEFMIIGVILLLCAGFYLLIYSLVIVTPQLALTARRFHDTNRTMFIPVLLLVLNIIGFIIQLFIDIIDPDLDNGWSLGFVLVFSLISFILGIYQLVITCFNSKFEKNKYGESPKFKNLKPHHEEV